MRYALRVSPDAITVLAIDEHGEAHDLNARGEPCRTAVDVVAFLDELRAQGADIPAELRAEALAQVAPAV